MRGIVDKEEKKYNRIRFCRLEVTVSARKWVAKSDLYAVAAGQENTVRKVTSNI